MNCITVPASKEYRVHIGSGLLSQIGEMVSEITNDGKIAIISDSNVWPLHGEVVSSNLKKYGHSVYNYVFPAGEESKNGNTYLQILNFLAENTLTRSDLLIALGGGVVGDMTGFVAATYLRGVGYIQIPTTLLAMVDSSVGGKTAIDLPAGKNLAGAFYQPNLVICDIDTLSTLPAPIFRDGCAEVIKYGILYDAELTAHLQEYGLAFDKETVISRCISLKRDVVAADEFDRGERQKLNLGHTFGHGIEKESNFSISHGKAVSIGMAMIAKAACAKGYCDADTKNKILAILKKFALPTSCDFTAKALYESALSDKKRSGNTVNLIIPKSIGICDIHPTPIQEMLSFIELGF